MAKPRPIRLKGAPITCDQEIVAFWYAVDGIGSILRRPYGDVVGNESDTVWRLPYDHRRAY